MTDKQKHHAALANLYKSNFKKLFLYAVAHFEDDALAEEAVQEVFALAQKRIDEVTACSNPAGWLMGAQKHIVQRKLRERRQYLKTFISIEAITAGDKDPRTAAPISPLIEWSGTNRNTFYASYLQGEQLLSVCIFHYTQAPLNPMIYEKDDNSILVYEQNGIEHYIMSNNARLKAVYMNGDLECSISGNLSQDEIIKMIDSIY